MNEIFIRRGIRKDGVHFSVVKADNGTPQLFIAVDGKFADIPTYDGHWYDEKRRSLKQRGVG